MYKIGTFFIFLGVFLIVLYLFSDLANTPTVSLLFAGGILAVLGGLIWNSDRPPREKRSERFRILRQAKERPPRQKGKRNRKKEEDSEERED